MHPYAPETKPIEHVWGYAKAKLANKAGRAFEDIKQRIYATNPPTNLSVSNLTFRFEFAITYHKVEGAPSQDPETFFYTVLLNASINIFNIGKILTIKQEYQGTQAELMLSLK